MERPSPGEAEGLDDLVDKVITLEEGVPKSIAKNDFDEDLAKALYQFYKDRIHIEWPTMVKDHYTLTSKGWIGHIPIQQDAVLQIKPKVEIKNIFRMLDYAYDLKSFYLFEGLVPMESIEDLFENLASILAKTVLDRARKGLYRGYLAERDRFPYCRGRIEIVPSILSSMCGDIRLTCDYEENTADVDENRLLAWTLYQMPKFQLAKEAVRQRVRQAYRAVSVAVETKPMTVADCINRSYNGLNEDYRRMHSICRFFLEHTGPSLNLGEHSFIPFLIGMPYLFESFVAKWLRLNLPKNLYVETKYHAELDPDGNFFYDIDLVLKDSGTDQVLAVLDTKYKREERPDPADINQVVAYAARMATFDAFLIYPSSVTCFPVLSHGKMKVRCLNFDLNRDLDESGELFLKELKEQLAN